MRGVKGHVVAIRFGQSVQTVFVYGMDTENEAVDDVLYDMSPRAKDEVSEIRVIPWPNMKLVPNLP